MSKRKGETVVVDARGLEPPEPYMVAVERLHRLRSGEEMVFITDSWRCAILFRADVERNKTGIVVGERVEKRDGREVFFIHVIKL